MKLPRFFLIIFLLIMSFGFIGVIPSKAQHHNPKRMIIFKSKKKKHICIVGESSRISVQPKESSRHYKGKVNMIFSDTLCFRDTCFTVHSLNTIRANSTKMSGFGTTWQAIVPPGEIYLSHASIRHYCNNLESQTYREWRNHVKKIRIDTVHQNFLRINLARFLHYELAISYERLIEKNIGIDFELGYEFTGEEKDRNGGIFIGIPLNSFSGPSLLAGLKFYNHRRYYFGPELHLKYLVMIYKDSRYPSPKGYASRQDQYKSVVGLSLRVGMVRSYHGVIVDYYAGIGLKYEYVHQFAYYYYHTSDDGTSYYNPDHTPLETNYNMFWPIINFGIKIGFGS